MSAEIPALNVRLKALDPNLYTLEAIDGARQANEEAEKLLQLKGFPKGVTSLVHQYATPFFHGTTGCALYLKDPLPALTAFSTPLENVLGGAMTIGYFERWNQTAKMNELEKLFSISDNFFKHFLGLPFEFRNRKEYKGSNNIYHSLFSCHLALTAIEARNLWCVIEGRPVQSAYERRSIEDRVCIIGKWWPKQIKDECRQIMDALTSFRGNKTPETTFIWEDLF